jgi:class 3 adenylate cyclase
VEAERRQVTVLFADMVGFTAFSERSGEEAAFTLMRSLAKLMDDAVREQGGVVQGFTGDGIMAAFGAPVAFEDAPLRACRAALSILQKLKTEGPELKIRHGVEPQVRIGLNSGAAVVGTVQAGSDAGVTVLGDTVNVAARLQSLAGPGEIVLSEAMQRLVQGLVDVEPAGEHEVKGKTEKQKIFRLRGIRRGVARFDRSISVGLTAYAGRSREMEVLESALESVKLGLRVIDIEGEPGIGKSRLAHEFRKRIVDRQVFVLSGNCAPDGRQTPFLPFIDIVRGSFRVSEGAAEAEIARKLDKGLNLLGLASEQNLGLLLNLLGLKPPEGSLKGLDGVLVGLRTRDLLLQLLQARRHLTPVIMVLEDLHWIDSVSEELLTRLITAEEKMPLVIIETHRPEYQPPWADQPAATRLVLQPLASGDTSEIFRARLGVGKLPAELAALVIHKAEGNPLFAEEIANYLVERAVVRRHTDGIEYDRLAAAAALPGSIQSLLSARADRLSQAERALLQAASVIGRRFSRDLLAAVTQAENIDTYLSAIEALDLIQFDAASNDFIFKHALVRDALYNNLLQEPRSALHLAVATEIEQRSHNRIAEVAETLAYHYSQTTRDDKRFAYLLLAGEKSLGVYALNDAEQYLNDALKLFATSPACTDDAGHIRLVADMSYVLVMTFRPGEVARLVERHRTRVDAVAVTRSVIVLSNYCLAMLLMCRMKDGVFAAKQALQLASRLGDDASNAYARAASIMCNCILGEGDIGDIRRQVELGLEESERTDDGYLRSWIYLAAAWGYLELGLNDRARELALELQARGRARGDPRPAAIALWVLGWTDIVDEKFQDAFEHGSECIRISLTPFDREVGTQVKGVALIGLGRVTEGVALLIDHRRRAIANEFMFCRMGTDGPLGLAMVLQGDLSGGVRFLESAIRHREQTGSPSKLVRLMLAQIYIEMLAAKSKPPIPVLLRNLPFLIGVKFTGWNKALQIYWKLRSRC